MRMTTTTGTLSHSCVTGQRPFYLSDAHARLHLRHANCTMTRPLSPCADLRTRAPATLLAGRIPHIKTTSHVRGHMTIITTVSIPVWHMRAITLTCQQ